MSTVTAAPVRQLNAGPSEFLATGSASFSQVRADFRGLTAAAINACRVQIAEYAATVVGQMQDSLAESLSLIDAGLDQAEPEKAVEGLSKLATSFGRSLQYESFENFDEFMQNSAEPLWF